VMLSPRRTRASGPWLYPRMSCRCWLNTWRAGPGPTRVFVGRDGRPMRGDAMRQAFDRARRKAGMSGFRFHDLRHTGQTLAATTGRRSRI
jgi:integrase